MSEPLSDSQLLAYALIANRFAAPDPKLSAEERLERSFGIIRALIAEVDRLKAENAGLKRERDNLFVAAIASHASDHYDYDRQKSFPPSKAIAWGFEAMAGAPQSELSTKDEAAAREALAEHDRKGRVTP